MLLGTHVSAAGGIENAPKRAHQQKCEVFQFFTRSPRGGKPKIDEARINLFKETCTKYNFKEYFTHSPYYINLASNNNRIRYGSTSVIREELEIGTKLGVKYHMFHMGSAKDFTKKKASQMCVDGIKKILKGYKGTTMLLIENSAGAGQIMGNEVEEIAEILKKVNSKHLGVCWDTCHGFASGYDLRDKTAITKTIQQIDNTIDLNNIKMFHLNDSKTEFNSKRDRHANIGEGEIGKKGFEEFINCKKIKNIPAILETPDVGVKTEPKSLKLLKRLRYTNY